MHLEQKAHREMMADSTASSRCAADGCRKWCSPGESLCREHGSQLAEHQHQPHRCTAPGPFDRDPQWSTVVAADRPSAGSGGLLFVQTLAGVYAVKTSATAAELFAMELALTLGLPAPRTRVLVAAGPSGDEYQALLAGVGAMQARQFDLADGVYYGAVDKPMVLVMEMLPQLQMLEGMAADKVRGGLGGHAAHAVHARFRFLRFASCGWFPDPRAQTPHPQPIHPQSALAARFAVLT